VIDRYGPTASRAGDFHDAGAAERMSATDLKNLATAEDREWIWLTGNHDGRIADIFGGRVLGLKIVASGCATVAPGLHHHEIRAPPLATCAAVSSAGPASLPTVAGW
jgi:metallophosphoesterase superfamily enzyme